MIFNNNINSKKSQFYTFLFAILAVFIIFCLILFLNVASTLKVILVIFSGLIPLFIFRPVYFIYFIFLVTPAFRVVSQSEALIPQSDFQINFNAILQIVIIIVGLLVMLFNLDPVIKQVRRVGFIKLLFAFIFLATVSLLYSINQTKTLEELVRTYSILFVFVLTMIYVQNKRSFLWLIACMIGGGILPAFVGVYQFATGTGWLDSSINRYRVFGTLIHPATFAFYLLSLVPICYALFANEQQRLKKILYIIIIALFSFLIIASLTRGAWIAFLAILLFYGLTRNRKALALMAVVLFAAYLVIPSINSRVNDIFAPKENSSFQTRLNILNRTLPAFYKAPLLGQGFGTFEEINMEYNEEAKYYESKAAHNDYLRFAIELGSVGLVIYLLLCLSLVVYFSRAYFNASNKKTKNFIYSLIGLWFGAFAIAAGDNLLRTVPVEYVLWGYTAAVLKISEVVK